MSERMPSILVVLGNLPQYLPYMISGLSERRSGTREGYICNEYCKNLKSMGIKDDSVHLYKNYDFKKKDLL